MTWAKVIGIAGNKDDFLLHDLHLDRAVKYQDLTRTLGEKLDKACLEGNDFVYNNVAVKCWMCCWISSDPVDVL
jgi:NADPH-dependent curcumin reductase CurA